ncbi:cadherin-like domain-containing protein [Flavisolibacter sp. BT320]|nr:cadherin-like domain-containing protein [Flavisolibacter longurius]
MKQIFTLFVFCFFAIATNAQFTEKFENYSALTSNCWQLTATQAQTGTDIIEGASSIETIDTETAIISSPYLDFTGATQVSFTYRLSNKLANLATRSIEIGTTDKNGVFTIIDNIPLNKNTAQKTNFVFNRNLNFSAGTSRFTIRIVSYQGDGNTQIVIDNLSISSASLHYSPQSCNTAPVVTDASFATLSYATFNGNLASFASDANAGESLTFALETLLTNNGTLVVNSDGTFAFTPNGDFPGGDITFTYKVTDNGYDPLSSNIATVTINFAAKATLPVIITNFSGSIAAQQAQLAWSVAQNQDGEMFEVQKSHDGKNFMTVARVLNTQKTGAEQYSYFDGGFKGIAYYRLKVINKNESSSYSKTIVLQEKNSSTGNSLTLLQNPVLSSIQFSYSTPVAGAATVNLYTTSGVKVFSTTINMQRGTTQTTLATNNKVVAGTYVLEVVHGSERSLVKLVKL